MRVSPASKGRGNVRKHADVAPDQHTHAPSKSLHDSKRRADTHHTVSQSGGAKAATLHDNPSTSAQPAASSRHMRHRQPPRRPTRALAGDRVGPPHEVRQAMPASLPLSSPAQELLRRARATAAIDTDWLGRRPFIMDVILGSRRPEYGDGAVLEAVELYQAALGPAHGVYDAIEDERSLELYWEAQAARVRSAAGDETQHLPVPAYQVSAERSTAIWAGDEDAGMSPPSGPRHISVSRNAAAHE